jgi:hypothetical protein
MTLSESARLCSMILAFSESRSSPAATTNLASHGNDCGWGEACELGFQCSICACNEVFKLDTLSPPDGSPDEKSELLHATGCRLGLYAETGWSRVTSGCLVGGGAVSWASVAGLSAVLSPISSKEQALAGSC